jgi:catechol 2,3-dioxygenase-like lactoylglutathione lyase family enzyme
MPARGLDHVAHAVRDLDAVVALYRRLGFTVGARNRHPWGTHNHIVQLPGFFIELLTVAEPDKLGDNGIARLFGEFHRNFIAATEGLSLLVLESKDSKADVAAYRQAAISASGSLDFEREAKRPDGTPIKVGFSLAFADDPKAPMVRFMTCQQNYPENFWNPAFQIHANGASDVRAVVMVAQDPVAHRGFAAAFTGSSDFYEAPGEVSAITPRGAFSIMTPDRFAAMFGGPAPASNGRLQAIRIAVVDIAAALQVVRDAGVVVREHRDGFIIDSADAMGAVLSFEPLAKSKH